MNDRVSKSKLGNQREAQKASPSIRPQVNEAVRLVKALLEIIPASDLSTWLHTPNPGFGAQRPWALIQKGERDVIWEMIHQTRQGSFA